MKISSFVLAIALLISYPALAQQTVKTCAESGAVPANCTTIVPPVGVSTSVGSSSVLKTGKTNVIGFQVNSGGAAVWVMLFDSATVPADGTVTPKKLYQLPANSTLTSSWSPGPFLALANGAVLVCSSTGPFTKTASATCAFSGEVQ